MDHDRKFFSWPENSPYGLSVSVKKQGQVAAEIMYEDDATKIKDRPIFLGTAIPLSRFYYTGAIILLVIISLIVRAFWIQGVMHDYYQAKADSNRLRYEITPPPRGVIVDRSGLIIAENESTFDVTAVPLDLPINELDRREILGKVARITGTDIAELQNAISEAGEPDRSVVLVRDIPYEQAIALKIELVNENAIKITHGLKRRYRYSDGIMSLSHILGYVGSISPEQYEQNRDKGYLRTDLIGKTGVEASYEFWLRGERGERVVEVDAHGNKIRTVREGDPKSGNILELSIDLKLQKAAEEAIKKAIDNKEDIKRATAIAMDPTDGKILAIVSWPAYDNNVFSGKVSSTVYGDLLNNENTPLLPRAWAGLYPSGSTIKPVYAVAALADKIITPNTIILSTGGIRVGARLFPDWRAGGHGPTNVRSAIAWSVNTFFYTIGGGTDAFKGLGANRMAEWLWDFGFGSTLGLDIIGENAGLVPTPEWRVQKRNERWFIGDTYNYSIGQGDLLVTPLQIAASTAVIANGGNRIRPHLILNEQAYSEYQQKYPKDFFTEQVADKTSIEVVRLGMRDTVLYGSGRALANMPIEVAGKTGTAQWRTDRPNHAWFTCFAPFNNPKVVVTVLLEEGVEGSETAIPVARDILMAWQQIYEQR
jgi:penicillin-binding protein 2